jgi:LacI family transcriptional regulator
VLVNKQVDGIIFVATGDQIEQLHFLLDQGIPVVMIDRDLPEVAVDTIIADNCLGGQLATQHLIELGHRRIACITGPSSSITPSAGRLVGYRQALSEAGIPYEEPLVRLGDYHPQSGMEITGQLLCLPSAPTAIFACNDLMALGALRAAVKAGLRVPEDLSIVGFDDIELASYTNPPLTTIRQPKNDIGVLATQTLARRIANKGISSIKVMLPTHLIVRESSAPVKQIG